MAMFVLNRDKVVVSTTGHSIQFKKGVPIHVPPSMHQEVMAVGALPQEDLPVAELPPNAEPIDQQERDTAILTAIELIVNRNAREDFTATGTPDVRALKEILGFPVHGHTRDKLWKQFQNKDVD